MVRFPFWVARSNFLTRKHRSRLLDCANRTIISIFIIFPLFACIRWFYHIWQSFDIINLTFYSVKTKGNNDRNNLIHCLRIESVIVSFSWHTGLISLSVLVLSFIKSLPFLDPLPSSFLTFTSTSDHYVINKHPHLVLSTHLWAIALLLLQLIRIDLSFLISSNISVTLVIPSPCQIVGFALLWLIWSILSNCTEWVIVMCVLTSVGRELLLRLLHYKALDSWMLWLVWSIWLLYQMGYLFLESIVY